MKSFVDIVPLQNIENNSLMEYNSCIETFSFENSTKIWNYVITFYCWDEYCISNIHNRTTYKKKEKRKEIVEFFYIKQKIIFVFGFGFVLTYKIQWNIISKEQCILSIYD